MEPERAKDLPAGARGPEVTDEEATRLFELALLGSRRPIDDVIHRLRQPDGTAWLDATLAEHAPDADRKAVDRLPGDPVNLSTLVAMKDRCKGALSSRADLETRTAATATYFLIIAAALAHHRTLLTRQKHEEVEETLSDLAAVTPPPWTRLLVEALATIGAEDANGLFTGQSDR